MAIKSRAVLPYLVPQLTATPVNTKALSVLAAVAGETLTKHLHKILPALLSVLAANPTNTQVSMNLHTQNSCCNIYALQALELVARDKPRSFS